MDGGGGGGGTYSGRVGSGARVGKGSALDMVGKLKDSALSVVTISEESPPSSSDPPAGSVGKGLIFRRGTWASGAIVGHGFEVGRTACGVGVFSLSTFMVSAEMAFSRLPMIFQPPRSPSKLIAPKATLFVLEILLDLFPLLIPITPIKNAFLAISIARRIQPGKKSIHLACHVDYIAVGIKDSFNLW